MVDLSSRMALPIDLFFSGLDSSLHHLDCKMYAAFQTCEAVRVFNSLQWLGFPSRIFVPSRHLWMRDASVGGYISSVYMTTDLNAGLGHCTPWNLGNLICWLPIVTGVGTGSMLFSLLSHYFFLFFVCWWFSQLFVT